MTDETTNFLFVDGGSESQGYKIGYRHDIRSHVRKHNAKRFNERHKAGQKEQTSRNNWTPLVSQSLRHQTSKSVPQEVDLSSLNVLLENANIYTGNALDLRNHDLQENTGSYSHFCPYCFTGKCLEMRQTSRPDHGGMVTARTMRKHVLNLSPFEPLGSGRIDPFLSYPVENPGRALHELMDFSVTYVTPGLVPDVSHHHRNNTANTVAKSWFSAGLKAPFLFYALAFVASVHRDCMFSSTPLPNSPQALSYKLLVIQKLKEYISKGSKTCRDEVILTILALAHHEVLNVTEEKRKPFNTPLKTLQWMNVYGNIHCVPEHTKAVLDLIALRGGIDNIQLPGLAEVIVRGDLVWALNNFSKPVHPPLRIYQSYISSVKEWAISLIQIPIEGKAPTITFPRHLNRGITYGMFEVLDSMRAIAMAIDHHLQAKPAGLTLGAIAKTRIAVQQHILLLPTIKELKYTAPAPNAYECCRLTAVIFSVAVFFPIPNTYDVLQTLARQLKSAINVYFTELREAKRVGKEDWELLLWILVLGGIAALDKPERPWYISQLVIVVDKLVGRIDWEVVEGTLKNYLWLDSACGYSGRELWEEIESVAKA
ncbi:hypothetical protein N431DRAFT_394352 [Stipitochalara longipes BDJ]|nr:hypothetical protein N431DRAFT_394352 [Stipitochalara longipes BDJ]